MSEKTMLRGRGSPMLKCYIAYFDLLGFKDFILNSDSEEIQVGMGQILTRIEGALAKGVYQMGRSTHDVSDSKINCINISDTIIFWTNDLSKESFEELLDVAYRFNQSEVVHFFSLRGALICDEIKVLMGKKQNNEGTYTVSLLYGKGIVKAHLKAESLDWAGSVIDQSVVDEISKTVDYTKLLQKYAKKYLLPYKAKPDNQAEEQAEEYALKLVVEESLDNRQYNFYKDGIERAFTTYNRKADSETVKQKLKNTLLFLDTFKNG